MVDDIYVNARSDTFNYPIYREPEPIEVPTLEEVLDELNPIPAYSLLLGLCEDEIPLILDLTDPRAGAFLIVSDNGSTNSTLLYNLLTAAYKVNTEEEVNLHLISPDADDLTVLHKQPNLKVCFAPDRPECEVVIEEMVNLVHQRQGSHEIQPVHILAIDRLDLLFQTLSMEAQLWFSWLLEFGAEVGLWIIATIPSNSIKKTHYGVIEGFPSRILGMIQFPRLARYLSGMSKDHLDDLIPDGQFLVRTDSGLNKIWMLETEE